MYFVSLLRDGFGFASNSAIVYQNNINGTDVAWAFGAMIYEANLLPWSDPVMTSGELTSAPMTTGEVTTGAATTGQASLTSGEVSLTSGEASLTTGEVSLTTGASSSTGEEIPSSSSHVEIFALLPLAFPFLL